MLLCPLSLTVTMAMPICGHENEVGLAVLGKVDSAVRATGCTKLLLKEAEGPTKARTYPAMQAMERADSFMLASVTCSAMHCCDG